MMSTNLPTHGHRWNARTHADPANYFGGNHSPFSDLGNLAQVKKSALPFLTCAQFSSYFQVLFPSLQGVFSTHRMTYGMTSRDTCLLFIFCGNTAKSPGEFVYTMSVV